MPTLTHGSLGEARYGTPTHGRHRFPQRSHASHRSAGSIPKRHQPRHNGARWFHPINPVTMSRFTFSYRSTEADEQFPITAQEAGEELDRIKSSYGTLHPTVVVNESRPEEAPLHPIFEWRDPVAAEKYREHQAQHLIKQVRVSVPDRPAAAPASTTVRPDIPTTEYQPMPVDQFDPLAFELSEALGAVVQAHRLVEQLRVKANRRNDTRKRIAADVASASLTEAEEACAQAEESLQNVHQPQVWRAAAAV